MSAVVPALSGSTVPLCPRICLRIQVQLRVLDALKAAMALENQLVQYPHTRIQVCVPDPVGVKQIEFVRLWHLSGGHYLSGEYSVGTRNSDKTPFSFTVSEPPAVSSEAFFAASQSGSALNPAKLSLAASWLLWASR